MLDGLASDKHSSLLGPFVSCQENGVLWIRPLTNTSGTIFSSKLTNGLNKLVCPITLSWKGLLVTNTLAYWAHLLVVKKMECCEYDP
jgi:hypothetical protein